MYKLLRMAVFVVPLAGGAAWAQSSGAGSSAGAPLGANPTGGEGTLDTRTPTQKRAGQIDEGTSPAVPGDATKPAPVPQTVPQSDRAGMPESAPPSGPSSDTGKAKPEEQPQKGAGDRGGAAQPSSTGAPSKPDKSERSTDQPHAPSDK
jgi:hypothetical protein